MRRRWLTASATFIVVVALGASVATAFGGSSPYSPEPERRFNLAALSNAFTFQGRLTDAGAPANGAYDFTFYLYDAAAGGSQVGPVQTVGDVNVAAGLFTVTLDFGDVFHGSQYYLEVQVRPGASSGAYTILTPRDPITAVPNASFAKDSASTNALQGTTVSSNPPAAGNVLTFDGTKWGPAAPGGGGFALPYEASRSMGTALFVLTNSGDSSGATAIIAESESTAAGANALIGRIRPSAPGSFSAAVRGENLGTAGLGIGVYGTQEGGGWGVYGETPTGRGVYGSSASGTGVYGASSSGNGGYFSSTTGDALEISGRIRVSGAAPAAFEHQATIANITIDAASTQINNPATNGNPNALLIVTPIFSGVVMNDPVGVYYDGARWRIRTMNGTGMPVNARFNVLVINQ